MARIYIDNPISSQFAMVPNVLWRWPGLSFRAKGFFAYLLSHRDGSCPPVAAMEAETGLGRDARKAAMAELIAAGLARWQVQRDQGGRLLSKRLEVTTRPLLVAVAQETGLPPENPSDGRLSPEKPSDGKSVSATTESRRCATENPAILQNPKQNKGARSAAGRPAARSASSRGETSRAASAVVKGGGVDVSALTDFQRARLLAGQSCLLDGQPVLSGSPLAERLRVALRSQDAEKSGGRHV